MKKYVLAAAFAISLATSAFASQCPSLMQKIDAAMATTTVDDATKTKVQALYDSGKAAHEAGDHPKSEADLGEAMKLLGI
jgi:Skp family chaperone for outer membrane proteins